MQLAARQVLALVVLVRVQAAQPTIGDVCGNSYTCRIALIDRFIFLPDSGPIGPSPGLDVTLLSGGHFRIHGWYLAQEHADKTILHFHGNAGNLEGRRNFTQQLRALGVNVLAIDYRGYGRSEGKPSEDGVFADARAAYNWLLDKTTADKIVIHGESLGGGPACELASTVPCGGLILQSTFTSVPDFVHRVARYIPLFLVRTKFDNLSKVTSITCPKLFIHSRTDEMIPFDLAEKLFAAAAEPKENAWFTAVGHNEMSVPPATEYFGRIAQFVSSLGN